MSSISDSAIKKEILDETPSKERSRSSVKLNFVDEKDIEKIKRTKNIKKKVVKNKEQVKEEERPPKENLELQWEKKKLNWLKIELKLVDINIAVKTALNFDNPDTD